MYDEQRTVPVQVGDERATLTSILQYQRDTLMMKCAGLTPEQVRRKAIPTTGITLLGLVRHLAEVERGWFRNVVNGEDIRGYWPRDEAGRGTEWEVGGADPDEAFAVWERTCELSRAIVDGAASLDVTGRYVDEARQIDATYSLHYVLTHMIEEYARHNGHADLLREAIDGTTGE
ncbi:DinB family protein [Streptomyces sp. G-G2]|uniref:DinB family protein n=1 Tax=Streptomyces sp. G-G2 TaxID=3046201 RepID=UPI0024BB5875|nr:DinB family protein [Streptomyces sp. G-G2]MDJ0386149.1 DinB family protein [Streptomyces sp. G-G2]